MSKFQTAALVVFAAIVLIILGFVFMVQPAIPSRAPGSAAIDPSKYYAVVLSNNSVYFGKLEGLGSPYPVLKDVYYVQSNVDPQTKEVKNTLIKRGKEWHAPDRMILNEKMIVFVEPVGDGSLVQQRITESKHQ
jgi:hypothetical protein